MKKRRLVSLLAAATLLVFVAGCGKNADESTNTPAPSTSQSGSKTETAGGSGTTQQSSGTTQSGTTQSGTSGNNNSSQAKPAEQTQPAEKVVLGPLKAGETAKLGPLTVTLKQLAVVDRATGIPPGYVYLVAELSVLNEGAAAYTLNITDHFRAETPEGKKAPYNPQATALRSPRLQGTVEQGKSIEGWLGYLSKKVAGKYKYQFVHPEYGEATWEFSL